MGIQHLRVIDFDYFMRGIKVKDGHFKNEAGSVLDELCQNPYVQQMDSYMQHGKVTTFEHCVRVARLSERLNHMLNLHCKEDILIRGAMLHDFYLYDWHNKDGGAHNWHGFIHADRAMRNAKKFLQIGEEEEQIIYSHMWPLNITMIPKSKEACIFCIADKIVSAQETVLMR